jgi:hypothetical protein
MPRSQALFSSDRSFALQLPKVLRANDCSGGVYLSIVGMLAGKVSEFILRRSEADS